MKARYRLFLRRKSVYYAFDNTTRKFQSLDTKERDEAERLIHSLNEAARQPAMNLRLARLRLSWVRRTNVRSASLSAAHAWLSVQCGRHDKRFATAESRWADTATDSHTSRHTRWPSGCTADRWAGDRAWKAGRASV